MSKKALCIFELSSDDRVTVTYSTPTGGDDKGPACRICLKDPATDVKLGWFSADAFRRLYDHAKDGDETHLGPVTLKAHVKESSPETMTVTYTPRDASGQESKRQITELDDMSCEEIRAVLRAIYLREANLKYTLVSVLEVGVDAVHPH